MSDTARTTDLDSIEPLDLAGVGVGPFNLSLAAQLDSVPELSARFFERRPRFDWHPGMMLPDVELQSSYLKDLVTSTNPTSPWSFTSYLVQTKRFFAFLNAHYDAAPRKEFARYFAWVAEQLPTLTFGADVSEVDHDGRDFVLTVDGTKRRARNLAIGVGMQPQLPDWAQGFDRGRCFHASEAVDRLPGLPAGRVAVIGGGQSGAEIVQHLLAQETPPQALSWLSRRHNFEPLNDTPFSNQVFSPEYVDAYRKLGDERKTAAFATAVLTSDGVSPSTIDAIYRRLYAMRYLEDSPVDAAMLPSRDVIQAEERNGEYRLIVRNGFDGGIEVLFADALVLATGYRFRLPDALAPLKRRIATDRQDRLILADDYSVAWDGPRHARIFALNAGRHSHGIAESQLSLMAWRSSAIVNALVGYDRFDLELPEPMVNWASIAPAVAGAARADA
ncbi:lysine N6-hydroxylase [Methylopila capsulata]|uniref:Lysine 6-monooxygenase n=1 Tax=Methylopila capsulata TaxID=61654 RepID=A0A9W6IXF8_9HYPH|nr:SidA/IucD/PvdA family monooxygenase [Methylopila capsulata]MBM7853423.1 lysine N6-hydroxylase [Methylopila capsulata]GLK57364.1 lysine 6-monooxygenase [Methylopila capsulata]